MKYSEIKDLTADELMKRSKQVRKELFELRMKHALGQVSSPITIRNARRSIAKIKTALARKFSK